MLAGQMVVFPPLSRPVQKGKRIDEDSEVCHSQHVLGVLPLHNMQKFCSNDVDWTFIANLGRF